MKQVEVYKFIFSQNEAATSFQVAIHSNGDPSHTDLVAGAGGDYRYLIRIFNPQSRMRI